MSSTYSMNPLHRKLERSSMLRPGCLLMIVLGSLLAGAHAKELVLVESKRPFIDFDIRHVNFNIESRRRAFVEIRELATGAARMHESLYTNHSLTRCASYGQLFGLIRPEGTRAPVRLSAVQELSAVVERNWLHHYELLEREPVRTLELFISAAEGLLFSRKHKYQNSRDAALDLINCSLNLASGSPKALSESQANRLKDLEHEIKLWLMFKAERIVSKKRRAAKRQSQKEVANVEQFHREALMSLSAQFGLQSQEVSQHSKESAIQLSSNETLIESHEPLGVWLFLNRPEMDDESELNFPNFHREQLKVMNFIKFRLLDLKNGRNFPVDVPLAIDFQTHWQGLKKYVTSTAQPNPLAVEFLGNKDNVKLAKLISYNLKLYNRFSLVFYRLSRKNFKFPSMKDYCNAIRKTKDSLNKINKYDLIDIDDIYRVFDFWFSTHQETCQVYWPHNNKIFDVSR